MIFFRYAGMVLIGLLLIPTVRDLLKTLGKIVFGAGDLEANMGELSGDALLALLMVLGMAAVSKVGRKPSKTPPPLPPAITKPDP